MQNNKTYAVYVRVSTDDQQERKTIESQIEFANKYCDLHELNVFKIYKEDGVTGTLPLQDRPVGAQLMQDAKNKFFDTLLVYKLDRLGRATRVILNAIYDLEECGVKLKSMTEPFDTGDASGRFLLTILAGVADLERSNILERMWHGANRAARNGKWLGGIVPYGYCTNNDNELEINETPLPDLEMSEANVIRLMYKLILEDGMTSIKIADHLNALGVPPSYVTRYLSNSTYSGKRKVKTAGIWRPSRVLNILKSTTYKGIHQYGKRTNKERDIIERPVPAIVSEEVWDKAQAVLKNNLILSYKNAKHVYLLRGLIKCLNCGHTYHGTVNGTDKSYYICNGRTSWKAKGIEKCTAKSINMKVLDDIVWNDCINYIENPDAALKEIKESTQSNTDLSQSLEDEKILLIKQLEAKDIEKQNILDLFRKKLISSNDIEKQLDKIMKEKTILQERIDSIKNKLNAKVDVFAQQSTARELLTYLKNKINSTEHTAELKKEIIESLVDRILVKTENDENNKQNLKITVRYKFNHNINLDGNSFEQLSAPLSLRLCH